MQVYILLYSEMCAEPRETWPRDDRGASSIARDPLDDLTSKEPNALDTKALEIEIPAAVDAAHFEDPMLDAGEVGRAFGAGAGIKAETSRPLE